MHLQKNDEVTTIYVGNLSFRKREGEVKKLFQKFGKVTYVKNILDTKTGHNKGFSFVQMPNRENALDAIHNLNGKVVDERTLKVSIAEEREVAEVKFQKSSKSSESNFDKNMRKKEIRKKQVKGLDALFAYQQKLTKK